MDAAGGTKPKSIQSKTQSSHAVLPELDCLVKFFSLVDTFYCFLVKNKLTCTVSRLKSMMGGGLDINKLLMLQSLCPRVLEVVLLPTATTNTQAGALSNSNGTTSNCGGVDSKCRDDELYAHLEVVFFIEGTRKVRRQDDNKLESSTTTITTIITQP
jgi:hypothetical protein